MSDIEIKIEGKSAKAKAFLIILAVSVAFPLAIHYILKEPNPIRVDEIPPAAGPNTIEHVYLDTLNTLIGKIDYLVTQQENYLGAHTLVESEEELDVLWLASPVTQAWKYDESDMIYRPASKDNYRSPPTIQIGLRSDGTVVWRKK